VISTTCRSLIPAVGLLGLTLTAAAPAVAAKPKPLVNIAKGPLSITTKIDAEFKLKASAKAKNMSCRRDTLPFRKCTASVKYTGLQAGRHVFKVRVRRGKKSVYVTRRWTVVPGPGLTPPYLPKAEPDVFPGAPPRSLIFADEFNGTTLNAAAWRAYDGPGHKGNGLRRSSAVSLDGRGSLVLTANSVNGTTVSGAIANRGDFMYGRLVFRVKTEADPTGTMSGEVATWPKAQLAPEWTENDIYSTGAIANNRFVFNSYVHFGARNLQKIFRQPADPSKWHTIIMDWTPDRLDVTRDGALVWSIQNRLFIPDVLHHVTIQLDARRPSALQKPVRMWVDYVRIYQ
jgi:hypothetical protein